MDQNDNQFENRPNKQVAENPKPDDYAGMYIRSYIKITDPESGEVLVENNR